MSERQYRGYGCVRCQRWHYEGDADFELHIMWQSKHGWRTFTATQIADIREIRQRQHALAAPETPRET